MTASAIPKPDTYTAGPGPYFEAEVNNAAQLANLEYGHIVSFTGLKVIPAAADAIQIGVSRGWRYDNASGKYYVSVDGSGAIVEVVYASAQAGGVKLSDNQTVVTTTDPTKWAGVVVDIPSTNVARIKLRKFAGAPYAS